MKENTTEPLPNSVLPFDPRDFRRALGSFATGVTVVTTLDETGVPVGFTANSFTSVSLDPPLILVCLAKAAVGCAIFEAAGRFAVNILADQQRDVSQVFASKGADKFGAVEWGGAKTGAPVLPGVTAHLDCETHDVVDAGDHIILIGRVVDYAYADRPPLCYCRGTYVGLEASPDVMDAAIEGAVRAGLIVERNGEVLLQVDPLTGHLRLPVGPKIGRASEANGVLASLHNAGVAVRMGFLFAVFENDGDHSVFYRATCASDTAPINARLQFFTINPSVLARVHPMSDRVMLDRYITERSNDLLGVYAGTGEIGEVRTLVQGDLT